MEEEIKLVHWLAICDNPTQNTIGYDLAGMTLE
jgi:hypothetical protein